MNKNELESLIQLENEIRGKNDDVAWLGYDYYPEIKDEFEKEFNGKLSINCYENFLLESYTADTYKYINESLRNSTEQPNEFVKKYTERLNLILDKIEKCNNSIVVRWHIEEEEFNFLKSNIGKNIKFPDFKSTSHRIDIKKNTLKLKIHTSSNSNGRLVYKNIDKDKGNSEKEVLFKTNSCFYIENSDSEFIYLTEIENCKDPIILADCCYYL